MNAELARLQATLGDRYVIERELGGGGMSRVYLAVERALERQVVIKVLAPELGQRVNIERFQREIMTSATLQHPQIVPVLHADAAGDLRYYVMPFVAGESLQARLAREGRLAASEVARLLPPLARALAYAHRRGVVHRDVKPGNILLAEGEPVLTDFGIAKLLRDSGSASGLTSAEMSIGTVTYMPPEQVTADPTLDGRADVYSLAAVGYELLTGSPPFTGSVAQVMAAHVVQAVPPLGERAPNAPPALVDAIMLGLSKSAADRPEADAFAAMLDAAGRVGATGDRPPAPRRALLVTIFAALLLGAGLAGWWTSRPRASGGEPVIAVLPFQLIGAAEDAYLSAGITDEITTALAQVRGVRVLSHASVRAYADSGFTPADYAAKAGVRALVEGSVQRADGQLRFSARLVETGDGSAVWSERYDRPQAELFRAQSEIGGDVVRVLTERLGIVAGGARVEHVADAEAYDLFLRGRYALRERGETGIRTAMTHFAASAARDARFAGAHAGFAEAAALLPIYSMVARASVEDTIRASAARAIALDSLLATPHMALGLLEKGLGRWAEGERALTRALALDPDDGAVHQNLGELFFTLGRVDEARAALERAALLEPTDETIAVEFAYALLLAGANDSASRVASRAASAAARNPFAAYSLSAIAERNGDLRESVRLLRMAVEAAPLPFFRGSLARAQWLSGDTAAARATAAALRATPGSSGVAFGRVIAGLPMEPADTLFAGLERAVAERDPIVVMLPLRVWWYDALRPDPRFAALARSLGLPEGSTAPLPAARR